jgi:hypothetical protein
MWAGMVVAAPLARAQLASAAGNLQGHHVPLGARRLRVDNASRKTPSRLLADGTGARVLSAVFDNIPLTALARNRGGYDWGHLAYAMGFGGSMIGFSSSAGVALANMYPDAKSAARWRLHGWHVTVA